MRSPILESIAGLLHVLKTIVERNDVRDLLAHHPTAFAPEQTRSLRKSCRRELSKDFPFCFRFGDLSWNFRAENNASLGNGLGPTVILFVTSLALQEQSFPLHI